MSQATKNSTITRADLAETLFRHLGLSRHESGVIIDQIIDEIKADLLKGDDVKIASFGTFSLREKSERVGRNPKTGVEATISPRKVVSFKASQNLKYAINKPNKTPQVVKE